MNIESKNYAGVACVLVRQRDGQPIPEGTLVETFKGDRMRVMGGSAPQSPASTGKVWLERTSAVSASLRDRLSAVLEYYPSVIDCEWVESASCSQRRQDGVAST